MKTKKLIIGAVVGTILGVGAVGQAMAADQLTPIEKLGKHIFFDAISIPGNKQACASCHDPARGWILPSSNINKTTVVAPGAAHGALGKIKPPANAYASSSPPFTLGGTPAATRGGNFWDGRAEGCALDDGCKQLGEGAVSETITKADIPLSKQPPQVALGSADDYTQYLGPTADQALNPFTPGAGEQNIREKNVCQRVKTANYKKLYEDAYGEPIDCSPDPQLPEKERAYHKSFKRIALSIGAWQASTDVNSFTSRRDKALACDTAEDPDISNRGKFPLVCPSNPKYTFTAEENRGHDLFYSFGPGNGSCRACHNGVKAGENPDPTGVAPHQLYTNNTYRNIGVPFNPEIPTVTKEEITGLAAHVGTTANFLPGNFRVPTTRNVAKGVDDKFTKGFTRNGWFKSLESLVHFYNTRDLLAVCPDNIKTEEQARMGQKLPQCWPKPEFDNSSKVTGIVGNLGMTAADEAALVDYLKTLSDEYTPTKP